MLTQQKRHLQISKVGRTILGGWGSWERYANESTGSDKEVFVFIKESRPPGSNQWSAGYGVWHKGIDKSPARNEMLID